MAEFTVKESNGTYEVSFVSQDNTSLSIKAKETNNWNEESVFENLECVSEFFEKGSVGYSPGKNKFDGLELRVKNWKVSILDVESVQSSFFDDKMIFPTGSVKFDNALLMRDIEHEWIGLKTIKSNNNM